MEVATPAGSMYHPAFGGVVRWREDIVPDDPEGQVVGTVRLMRQYALADALSPEVQREAAALKATPADQRELAERAYWRVKSQLQFVDDGRLHSVVPQGRYGREYHTVETLIRPRDMVAMGERGVRQGDCDDYSMYLASLLTACGVPCAFVVVAADPDAPDNYSHVYVAAYPNGERLAMDASHGPEPGWETPERIKIKEFPVVRGCGLMPLLVLGLIGYAIYLQGTGRDGA